MPVIRDGQHRGSTYVEGWRDQECDLCGKRWFICLPQHYSLAHGVAPRIAKGKVGFEYSASKRDHIGPINAQKRTIARQRWQRWVVAVEEERAKGIVGYCQRLAQRWRVNPDAVSERVYRMSRAGLISAAPTAIALNREKMHCKNGHRFTPDNTRVRRGQRECLECIRASDLRTRRTEQHRRRQREWVRRYRANQRRVI